MISTKNKTLSNKEIEQLLFSWNQTDSHYPKNKTIIDIFENQVKRTPDYVAVKYRDEIYSYKELNKKSNKLANYLISQNIKVGEVVGICMQYSVDIIISMLAVLKVGGVYVPIDINYPLNRKLYIIKDAEIEFILSNSKLDNNKYPCQIIDIRSNNLLKEIGDNDPSIKSSPLNACYIMYTSGSTGRPKGVVIPHRAVARLVKSTNYIEILPHDRIAQTSNLSFDASTFEIWGALLNGATLCMLQGDNISDVNGLRNTILQNELSIMWLTSSLFNQLIREDENVFGGLKYLLIGGEVLSLEDVKRLLKSKDKPVCFINGYGPTENTTFSTYYVMNELSNKINSIPIGRPIANTKAYILDKRQRLVPIGVPGELYIGGDGLAKGYLNRPKLTKEKFIPNPFDTKGKSRLYRTGDLVRWREDGNLEFIGRLDHQVKIRGFRVELEEIEYHLQLLKPIQQAVVLAKTDLNQHKYLVAYLVLDSKGKQQKKVNQYYDYLRTALAEKLPDYMIPNKFIILEQFPLNSSGKIDRKSLVQFELRDSLIDYICYPPKSYEEKILAKLWEQVLSVDRPRILDNFFLSGGHSLSALRLLALINEKFALDLNLRNLINYPTIQKLSEFIRSEQKNFLESLSLSRSSSLICLQDNKNFPALFFLPPIGGTIFCYLPLVQYLSKELAIYGLQDPEVGSENILLKTLESLANYYADEIQSVQSKGPYCLVGYSSGATLSIAVSRILKSRNQDIAFVGLIDGWAIYPSVFQEKDVLKAAIEEYQSKWQAQFILNGIKIDEKLFDLQWKRAKSLANYDLGEINLPLTLFKAKEISPLFANEQSDTNYWEKYTDQHFQSYLIPGNHQNILEEPNVKYLVQILQQELVRVDCLIKNPI